MIYLFVVLHYVLAFFFFGNFSFDIFKSTVLFLLFDTEFVAKFCSDVALYVQKIFAPRMCIKSV